MLTIRKVVTSIAYYLTGVAKDVAKDYYRDASICAEWFGRGAKAWGFEGEPTASAYNRMVQGFCADGKTKLTQNAGDPDRFPGFDLTFSANKYVSIAWGLERDASARKNIEREVMAAAKDALALAEQHCLFTRRGKGGVVVEKAVGMVSCLFLHCLSRPPAVSAAVSAPVLEPLPEPQLHVHAATGNTCLRGDHTSGTILAITASREDARNKRGHQSRSALHALRDDLGSAFGQSLRSRMEHLGYRTADLVDSKHAFWKLVGIPEKLVREFSSRRLEIKQDLERRGVSGGKEASLSARRTRSPKKSASLEDLFVSWRERANAFDPATIRAQQTASHSVTPAISDELRQRVEAKARVHVVAPAPRERTASATSGATSQHTARPASKQAAPSDRRRAEERRAGASHDDEKTLRAAAAVARILKSSRRKRAQVLTRANVWLAAKQVEYVGRTKFTPEEKAALVGITRKRGAVQFLGSGVRVEPVLEAARIGWHRQGKRVLLVTDSKREAERAGKLTGIHSMTTSGLLKGLSENRGLLAGYDAALKKSFKLPLGFRSGTSFLGYLLEASGKWLSLDSKTVLVVESASLDLTERAELLKKVHRAGGAKIVFVDRRREATQISEQLVRPRRELNEMPRPHQDEREQEQEQSR